MQKSVTLTLISAEPPSLGLYGHLLESLAKGFVGLELTVHGEDGMCLFVGHVASCQLNMLLSNRLQGQIVAEKG
jgi:hypothetical protein